MSGRLARVAFLVVAIAAWRVGYWPLARWVQTSAGTGRIADRGTAILVGHWLTWQLPAVVLCASVWLVGQRLAVMPSFVGSLRLGSSPRRVVVVGLSASAVLLAITFGLGVALGGKLGNFFFWPKALGDLASNLYEEIVFRGLLFSAWYGAAAGSTFALSGTLDRRGVIVGTIGSNAMFAFGHDQFPIALRIVLGVIATVFVWPWVSARSLWASYMPHTIGDWIGDAFLKL